MEIIFNLYGEFGEVRRAQLATSTLLTSTLVPWVISDLLRFVQMLKRVGCGKQTGNYRTYSIPGKTAVLILEFAVEDLPSAELQPRFLRLQ